MQQQVEVEEDASVQIVLGTGDGNSSGSLTKKFQTSTGDWFKDVMRRSHSTSSPEYRSFQQAVASQ